MLKETTPIFVETWVFALSNATNNQALGSGRECLFSVYIEPTQKSLSYQSEHSWGLGALFYYWPYWLQ